MKRCAALALVLLLSVISLAWSVRGLAASPVGPDIGAPEFRKIEAFVSQEMARAGIPGAAVAVVTREGAVYTGGFGTRDLHKDQPVTAETVFGIGPSSELFTALAVLRLAEQGKLHLTDPVDRVIPGFQVKYRGAAQTVTVAQLLRHTSGLPMGSDPTPGGAPLGEAVRAVMHRELAARPGSRYMYSPANYTVLDLVIEQASGQPYRQYLESLFQEMELRHTHVSALQVSGEELATGYNRAYLRPQQAVGATPESSTPGRGVLASASDLARWLSYHTAGTGALTEQLGQLQTPDQAVNSEPDGSARGMGWQVLQSGGKLVSSGGTAGYSSYMALRPADGVGLVVLANMRTEQTVTALGEGIWSILQGARPAALGADLLARADTLAVVSLAAAGLFSALVLALILRVLAEWLRGQRHVSREGKRRLLPALLAAFLFIGVYGLGVYLVPNVLLEGRAWSEVLTWLPASVLPAAGMVSLAIMLVAAYVMLLELLPKPYDKSYFLLGTLSVASGLGYTFIMFVISQALGEHSFGSGLVVYFVLAMLLYIYGQRVVRAKLIDLANRMVFEKRMQLADTLLRTSYARFQNIESGRIYASLGNDTEVISGSVRDFVTVITSAASLILCFAYLGVMSLYGLIFSVLFVAVAAGVQSMVNGYAEKVWGQVQETQSAFFRFINDLLSGFKELSMHRATREAFRADLVQNMSTYREQRIRVELLFTNGFILGQLLIYFVIGTVLFLFPLVFQEIQRETLRNYVLVFLFIVGPISNVVDLMPRATQMTASWKRITQLIEEAAALVGSSEPAHVPVPATGITLTLRAVKYRYKENGGESFAVGPLTCQFHAGEVVFITGGNGSGKSTLAKLMTGLYAPDEGEILVNGLRVDAPNLGEHFATVFSDFYLFDKLYGIDYGARRADIEHYLRVLQIGDKLGVSEDGAFSTTRLSTGQRKRLALLISYITDRPIYLFDEWAAEQDPEFRHFFYQELLPDLKARGKCVIAITHDDRYFGVADRTVKMEMGLIVNDAAMEEAAIAAQPAAHLGADL